MVNNKLLDENMLLA